jgi:hypothetical protein
VHLKDPRTFELWFSLGYDGDAIPTKDGKIDREELLGTTLLGAGYYKAVHTGQVQTSLKRQIIALEIDIEDGLREHDRLIKRYRDAFPGVAEISDALGGADLPSRSIWDHPNKLILKALELNVGGNVLGSQAYLVVAAIVTRNAALLLAEYAEKSMRGAGRAIAVLEVAKTAGEIAEIGLAITGIGVATKVVRGGAKVATNAARNSSLDAAAEQLANRYIAKNQISAADLATTRWVPGPKGSVAGGVKPGTSSGAETGFHKYY